LATVVSTSHANPPGRSEDSDTEQSPTLLFNAEIGLRMSERQQTVAERRRNIISQNFLTVLYQFVTKDAFA
jgi:hypothetical protein